MGIFSILASDVGFIGLCSISTNGHHLQMYTKSTNNCLISGILMKLHLDERNNEKLFFAAIFIKL